MREGKAEGGGGEEGKGKEKIKVQRKAQLRLRVHSGAENPPAPHIDPLLLFQKDTGRDAGVTRGVRSPAAPALPHSALDAVTKPRSVARGQDVLPAG